ncbi:MAG: 16S rRNA (uracil(1498)-N(3))-methyltransferase [Candidatus Eremiobacteraeota bacterium]|nr:16S rRNA (uracil(1498)-N(3))-methyltransferase [Candidatus Eremiobacteraeota bacterium]
MRDRFFVEGVHAPGDRVALASDDARKIVTVLRKRDGDRVQVIDSGGRAFAATLDVAGSAVAAVLDERLDRGPVESALRVTLAQAIPKGQKMDFVVEKATELGVHEIVPLRSARVAGDATGEHKRERWARIARAASQQSGRLRVPAIAAVQGWDDLLASFARYDRVFVPWELAEPAPLRATFENLGDATCLLVVIGPEGGFSAGEVARAQSAGGEAISLGRRIVRTETAALVVLAALLYARAEL